MSFRNPFKAHGPKKSAISRTAEREFEREVKKLEQLDENSKKIYKDMKRCIESQTAQCRSEGKMVQEFCGSPLCKEDEQLRQPAEQWSNSMQRLDAMMNDMNATSQKAVVEPVKKFTTIFPSVQVAVKKREQSLQEYSKCQAKVEKYQDKERTGANIVKLDMSKKALSTAKDDFDNQDQALRQDMPRLYEGRIDYFQPSFQALIKAQVNHYTECHKTYSELSERLNGDRDDADDKFDTRMQQKLGEIRALSITVDDR